jgi:hypothetical protein
MTTQSTAITERLPAHRQPIRPASAPGPVLRLHTPDWSTALNLGDDGFAALRFDAAPETPARTRRFLSDTLTGWHLHPVLDEVNAVAAELVANAIRHALTPPARGGDDRGTAWIALIHRQHSVICAVADPSSAPPVPREPDELAETGRGLCIVAALSEAWGHSPPDPAGKTVWARIPAPVRTAADPHPSAYS